MSGLADLARGLGGGVYPIVAAPRRSGGRSKASEEKGVVDINDLVGVKVGLSKEVVQVQFRDA